MDLTMQRTAKEPGPVPLATRFFRSPGLFAFVHRGPGDHRTLLFVDQSDNIAASLDGGHRLWADALRLGSTNWTWLHP